MGNKYYTPDISEFYVGFEYEMQIISVDICDIPNKHFEEVISKIKNSIKKGISYTEVPYKQEWIHRTKFSTLKNIKENIDLGNIRVKYLDKADIEELGFNCIKDNEYHYRFSKSWYNKSDLIIEYYIWYTGRPESEEVMENRKIHIYQTKGEPIIYKHDGIEEKIDVDKNIFLGTIRNKSELKVLLKQLGINEL